MPSLPFELERLIFEMAALQDTDHDSRVRLTLVSKLVREWIRPILYRVAIISDTVRPGRPSVSWRRARITDIAPYVRHFLVIGIRYGVLGLISAFHNLEDLAVWHCLKLVPEVIRKMNDHPLRMLSVDLSPIDLDEAATYQAFKNLTHLDIIRLKGSTWDDCKALTQLPKLTHLCFFGNVDMEKQVLHGLLQHCASLQALFIHLDDQAPDDQSYIEVDDPTGRYLALLDNVEIEYSIAEWERSANGQISIWELAVIIIKARKGKLFKDNTSVLFSRATWMDNLNDDGMRWYNEWSMDYENIHPN